MAPEQAPNTPRARWRGIIEEYREWLPVSNATPVISLREGDSPLLECPRLSDALPGRLRLFAKCEGANPTGSFKDRGMAVAVAKAVEAGATATICASTGNTSASAAAYCARAGIKCAVVVPEGHIALGKLAQAIAHGAQVLPIRGDFDAALRLVRDVSDNHPVTLVNSVNPHRIEGQKTAAFEICDVLGDAPDYHALPVGNAGNITAYWKGYREYHEAGRTTKLPHMLGFQAEGAAPIVLGHPVAQPETIATAIRIGNPASWQKAEAARDQSGGLIEAVSDDEIIEAYRLVARTEGIFVEPASGAGLAGLRKLAERGYFGDEPVTVVWTLTGHGLKDPERAIALAQPAEALPADVEPILDALGL